MYFFNFSVKNKKAAHTGGRKGVDVLLNELSWLWNTIATIGTVVGIVSLIIGIISLKITIKTFKKTENIDKKIHEAKIRIVYPDKHKDFACSVTTAIKSVEDSKKEGKSVKGFIVDDLLKTGKILQGVNASWSDSNKEKLTKFINFLYSIQTNDDLSNDNIHSLQNELYDILSTITTEGADNDIR